MSVNEIFQRLCAWAGPLFMAIMVPSFYFMDFLPPMAASLDAAEVAAHYDSHRTAIRAGATIVMQFAALMMLWVTAITVQLRRLEGTAPVFSTAQMLCGALANFGIVLMALAWTVAAFRPTRDIDVIQSWNDFGWLILLMPVFLLSLQAFSVGTAILADTRSKPLFPRWVGFFNFWVGLLFLPGALVTFFKTGPFAWQGLLVFWLGITVFIAWLFVMAWAVDRAIRTPAAPAGGA